MFKKPFEIRNNTQLKKSSKKQFRLDLLKTFPTLTNNKLSELIPRKENVFCMKISTHCFIVVNVYCVQKIPLVFELDNKMYPSIYMLWKVPDLIPSFITHSVVFSFVSGGADLMLPGVIVPEPITPNSYGNLEKGCTVCVTLDNNRAAAMAVGVTALSSSDMYTSNKRGKCVSILHFYGDHLSSLDTLLPVPIIAESSLHEQIPETTEILNVTASDKATQNDLDSANDDLQTEMTNKDGSTHLNTVNILNKDESRLSPPESQNIEAQMEELLMYSFLKCLKTSAINVTLPLLTSHFFKLHILAACPEGRTLELKRTKYKKLSNFLKEMEDRRLIKSETVSKGVSAISFINYDHELLKPFEKTYNHIGTEDKRPAKTDQKVTSIGEEMYSVNIATLPLFSLYLYKKQDIISKDNVRSCLRDYVEKQNLVDCDDKRLVIQDDLLKQITGESKTLSWPQLIEAVINKLGSSMHGNIVNRKVIKGKLSPIDIQVGSRSCNKKVTLVNNLEIYGINLKEFCQECQHGVAASTTINHPPSLKSAQVQVQGNQVHFVSKLLMDKYKIPINMIRGLENIQRKKK